MIYLLFLGSAMFMGWFAWTRRESVFDPHLVFTVLLIYLFYVDYLSRGDIFGQIEFPIPTNSDEIASYQIAVWATTLACWGATRIARAWLGSPWMTPLSTEDFRVFRRGYLLTLVVFLVVSIDILKRLYFSEWSISEAISVSLWSRGAAPWAYQAGNLGDWTFIFGVPGQLLPFAAALSAYRIVFSVGTGRVIGICGYLIAMALMIIDWSRTPVVIGVGALAIFAYLATKKRFTRGLIVTSALLALLLITSFQVIFRGTGLESVSQFESDYEVFYHQDDNFFQAVRAIHVATITDERWDPIEFFGTILVNPVPRYLWPDKPALLQEFWGDYKNEWTTISFFGEMVALFGPLGGLIGAVIVAIGLYFVLAKARQKVGVPGGIVVYLFVALYVYLVMRSLQNLSQAVYVPLFAWIAVEVAQRRNARNLMVRNA